MAVEPSSAQPLGAHALVMCFSEGQNISLVCAILFRTPLNRLAVGTRTPLLPFALPMTSPVPSPLELAIIHSLNTQ